MLVRTTLKATLPKVTPGLPTLRPYVSPLDNPEKHKNVLAWESGRSIFHEER